MKIPLEEEYFCDGLWCSLVEVTNIIEAGFLLCLFFNTEDGRVHSSEISVDFCHTMWHYILEDSTLHCHCCENLKSSKISLIKFQPTLNCENLIKVECMQQHSMDICSYGFTM
jgi:hypothetical protein